MKKLNVCVIVGTRPEAIKMAPVVMELKKRSTEFDVRLCVTGQHKEMLYQVLDHFELVPDVDLEVMEPNQTLATLTSKVLLGIQHQLTLYKPDVVLVHGDTTTAMAAGTACFYAGVPVAHVEAGLRTYNLKAPFPEEYNRRVIALCSDIHFAPTKFSAQNLRDELIAESGICVTGNTVIDALLWTISKIEAQGVREPLIETLDGLLEFEWQEKRYVLITGHRRENFGQGFENICSALAVLAEQHPDVHFVYPVHLNPNVKGPVYSLLSKISNVHLIPPLGYPEFAMLLKYSCLVLTDSGGIQEEAPSLGKPVLVMRDVTERPEAIEAGTVKLVSSEKHRIIDGVSLLLDDDKSYAVMARAYNPYGDGQASPRIADRLLQQYG